MTPRKVSFADNHMRRTGHVSHADHPLKDTA